jgi:hypothetical protein
VNEAAHLQSCPLQVVTCDLCRETHLRQDTENHIAENLISHFTALATELKQAKQKISTLERGFQNPEWLRGSFSDSQRQNLSFHLIFLLCE